MQHAGELLQWEPCDICRTVRSVQAVQYQPYHTLRNCGMGFLTFASTNSCCACRLAMTSSLRSLVLVRDTKRSTLTVRIGLLQRRLPKWSTRCQHSLK